MKAIIWIVIIAVIGLIAYTQLYKPLSEEEQQVKQLEVRFKRATRQFVGAARMAGGLAMDTIDNSEEAVELVKEVRKELKKLKSGLEEGTSLKKAKELEAKIKEFCTKNDIL